MRTSWTLLQIDPIWNKFVGPDINPVLYNYSKCDGSSGNFYISEASFINLQNAVIKVKNSDSNHILVSKSFFSNLYHENLEGGSIYLNGGYCIQYRVCSMNTTCKNSKSCHSYIDTEKNNQIIGNSISKCSGDDCSIYLKRGNQLIKYTNISYANCNQNAAYICQDPSKHEIKFTSIYNNTAQYKCIMLHTHEYQNVYRCKVINNECYQNGIVYFDNCIFLRIRSSVLSSNSGPYLFIKDDCEQNYFVVDGCFLDNQNVSLTSGELDKIKTVDEFDLNLHHLSTQKCDADFPLLEDTKVTQVLNPYLDRSQGRFKMKRR